jgi:hypothetical protein
MTRTDPNCTCPETARGPWDCLDCPLHGAEAEEYLAAEQQAEIDAENAWLRAAEAPTNDDLAFEAYEARMGLI